MKKSEINLFEMIVLIAIVLVTIFTFLEDFAAFIGVSGDLQIALMFAGFCFDLFFTVEFLLRLYLARFEKGIPHYLLHGYGWIDFFASIPLLMLSSSPHVAIYLLTTFGGEELATTATFFSLLKLIKIIRIARVLRLLRILKIFKTIKYTDTAMAQRHVAKIITVGVTVIVCVLLGTISALELTNVKRVYDPSHKNKEAAFAYIEKKIVSQKEIKKLGENLAYMDTMHNVLLVAVKGKTVYLRTAMKPGLVNLPVMDYEHFTKNGLDVYFDTRVENELYTKNQAKDFLIFYFVILFLIAGYLVFYSPHFALTITDPIKVMKRGMEERDYNLEVKIPPLLESDEIFGLAKGYNENYLPLKDRTRGSQEKPALDFSKDELDDIFELDTDDE